MSNAIGIDLGTTYRRVQAHFTSSCSGGAAHGWRRQRGRGPALRL